MPKYPQDPDIRFWAKVERTPTCWLWRGALTAWGYSKFWFDERHSSGHRYAYIRFRGPIPADREVDHLCRVRHCVNPDHLELVTPRENQLRGDTFAARNLAKVACVRGHPLDEANTHIEYLAGRLPRRACRACKREDQRPRNAAVSARRALLRAERQANPTCRVGDALTDANTYWSEFGGYRRRACRTCHLARGARYRAAQRLAS